MSNTPKPPVPASPRHPAQPGSDPAEHSFQDDLRVPQGVSRAQGLFLVGLMIIMLIIFIVPDQLQNVFSRKGDTNPITTEFQLPDGRHVQWRAADVITMARDLEAALPFDQFLGFSLGITERNPDLPQLERLLILDELAKASGVEITDADLGAHLREMLSISQSNSEIFKQGIRMNGLDQRTVEESIRALMRITRFTQMIGFAGAVPTPQAIEKAWHDDNLELAFDYVALELASLDEEARKVLPDDAALLAWFEKLPEGEREEFKSEEKRTAEVVLFRDRETTAADALVAAYPEKTPEGVEPTAPEDLAQQYYNRVFVRRFAKTPAEGSTEPAGFLAFDEVKEQCLAEAPFYFAMQRWLEDLVARKTNGETIDLSAEASKYGLEHQSYLQALTREGFEGAEGVNDKDVATAIFATSPDGSFYSTPTVTRGGLHLVRVNTRVEREMQPFEAIRERVITKWLAPKREELALARLKTLRDGFELFTPAPPEGSEAPVDTKKHRRASEEAFKAAVEGAGLTLARRDYLNKAGPASDDPASEDVHHKTLWSQAYSFGLNALEADEVAEPGLDSAKTYAYLVRRAGSREVPIAKMSPTQYQTYKRRARQQASMEIGKQLDFAFLEKNFGLRRRESEEKKAAEKAPAN